MPEEVKLLDKLKHLPKWAYVALAGGGVALIILYERNKTNANTSTVGVSPTDAAAQGLTSSNLDGYPLDSLSNLGYGYSTPQSGPITIDNGNPTPTPTPIPTPTQPGTPGPTPNPPGGSIPGVDYPLIPYGQLPQGTQYTLGSHLTWQGQQYTIGPGSNGVLWGVAGNVPVSQWQTTPIGQGGKIKLYGPQSSYPNPMGGGSTNSIHNEWQQGNTNSGVASHILDGDLFDTSILHVNGYPDLFERGY